jgi:hypothetical protein
MDRRSFVSYRPRVSATLALLAAIVLAGCGLAPASEPVEPGATPTTRPSDRPTPAPTFVPTLVPGPAPTERPSEQPGDDLIVDLDNVTGHDVTARIADESGALVGATSGTPGDGMSVRWYEAIVENVDDRTLRIVWVMLPMDGEVGVAISTAGDGIALHLVQPQPPDQSDAVGFDRVLVLAFNRPVDAGSVSVTIERSQGS